MNRTQIAINP